MRKNNILHFVIKQVPDYKKNPWKLNFSKLNLKKAFHVFAIMALAASFLGPTSIYAVSSSVDLDQCRNGSATSPVNCSGSAWGNGNAGSSNSHYIEGQSIPYRAVLKDLPVGSPITLNLEYDAKNGGKHAIDYLTSYDRINESVSPIDGVTGVSGVPSTFPIPVPGSAGSPVANMPTQSFNNLPGSERLMTIWNGSITNVAYAAQGSLSTSQSATKITISFTANATTVVIAWGGHIASRLDWGFDSSNEPLSAGGINGSPYHMRLDGWSLGNLGNTDRSMSASAIGFGNLTVIKQVVNINGNKQPSDFLITITGNNPNPSSFPGNPNGTSVIIGTGTYQVTEVEDQKYTASYSSGCSGSVVNGQSYICTITNREIPTTGTLVVQKVLTNDNGGTRHVDDFSFAINGGGYTLFNSTGENRITVQPGKYTVNESTVAGYSASYNNCTDINIAAGETKTCVISNDDQPAHLTVIKQVNNNYDGTAQPGDFTMAVTGAQVSTSTFPGSLSGTTVTMNAGSYSVSETGPAGYTTSGCSGSIGTGESKTCTLTSDDIQPKLTVIKVVDNGDNETLLKVSDFPLFVNDVPVVSGEKNGFNVGTVKVTESNSLYPVYVGAYSQDCDSNGNVILGLGDVKTCIITNTFHRPPPERGTITIIKHVVNDNGGTAKASDFTINISATNASKTKITGTEAPGENITAEVGSYSVTEVENPGYTATYNGCEGALTKEGVTCTITNDDIPAKLTVTKKVVNDEGGTAKVSDFTLLVASDSATTTVTSGEQNNFSAGSYDISENNLPGYAASYSGNCDSSGHITMVLAGTYSCTITNTYSSQSANLAVTKTSNIEGSVKVGNTVFYTITATNNGPDLAKGVVVNDVWPAGITFVSASTTAGSFNTETKKWDIGTLANGASVTLVLEGTINEQATGTLTNTAAISGSIPDPNSENNTASTDVVMYVPKSDLSLTKSVDKSSPNPGDTIVYTLTVANAGPDAATNVTATDTLPSTLTFVSASSTQGTYDNVTGLWDVGTLSNDSSATLQITATVNSNTAGQNILNEAIVASGIPDPVSSNNTASVSFNVTTPSSGGSGGGGGGGDGSHPAEPTGQVLGTTDYSNYQGLQFPSEDNTGSPAVAPKPIINKLSVTEPAQQPVGEVLGESTKNETNNVEVTAKTCTPISWWWIGYLVYALLLYMAYFAVRNVVTRWVYILPVAIFAAGLLWWWYEPCPAHWLAWPIAMLTFFAISAWLIYHRQNQLVGQEQVEARS